MHLHALEAEAEAADLCYANCEPFAQPGATESQSVTGYSRKLDRDGDGIGCEK
jgi:hypothetical protein